VATSGAVQSATWKFRSLRLDLENAIVVMLLVFNASVPAVNLCSGQLSPL